MLYFLAGIFTIAAIFGAWLLSFYIRKKKTNKKVVFIHGLFGGGGLMSFIVYISLRNSNPDSITPLFILLIAAFIGAVLFCYDLMHKKAPQWIWILHPIVALAGLAVLYFLIFNK